MKRLFVLAVMLLEMGMLNAQTNMIYELYLGDSLIAKSVEGKIDTLEIDISHCGRLDCYFMVKQAKCNDSLWLKTLVLKSVGGNFAKTENGVSKCSEKSPPVVLIYDKASMCKFDYWALDFRMGEVSKTVGKAKWYLKFHQ